VLDNRQAINRREKIDGTTALALADDPTIKSLTTKLADNPDDAGALLPARTGLCQQRRVQPCPQGLRCLAAAEPKDVEAFNNRC